MAKLLNLYKIITLWRRHAECGGCDGAGLCNCSAHAPSGFKELFTPCKWGRIPPFIHSYNLLHQSSFTLFFFQLAIALKGRFNFCFQIALCLDYNVTEKQ